MKNTAKYIVGNKAFCTKAEILEHAKRIKNEHEEFEPITDEHAIAFLMDLIMAHPAADKKIGAGIEFIIVGCNEVTHTKEFQICRTDGSRDHFSLKACIYKPNPNAGLYEACRDAIKGQITEFRREQFSGDAAPTCPFRETTLTHENSHVDHVKSKSFRELVHSWVTTSGLCVADVKLADSGAMRILGDKALLESWQEYHRTNAELRLVSIEANLSECKTQN